ncbi:hypothetical protein Tco_1444324, partial [Tanacetum coccineum]
KFKKNLITGFAVALPVLISERPQRRQHGKEVTDELTISTDIESKIDLKINQCVKWISQVTYRRACLNVAFEGFTIVTSEYLSITSDVLARS